MANNYSSKFFSGATNGVIVTVSSTDFSRVVAIHAAAVTTTGTFAITQKSTSEDKIKFQATLLDPSQKNTIHVRQDKTRSMAKMESLLLLWIQDLDQRGILVGTKQIQAKAKSLYLHVKENFEDKTEAEMKETFVASNGWLHQYKKRHDIKIEKMTKWNAKSGNHYETADFLDNKQLETLHHDLETGRNKEQAKIFDVDNYDKSTTTE